MITVYGLFDSADPDVIRYVGKAVSMSARLANHRWSARFNRTHKECWITSVLADGRTIGYAVLATAATHDEAKELEKRFIFEYRSRGYKLTNGTDGGDGLVGHKPTEESNRKRSEATRGRRRTLETRLRMSAARRGMKLNLSDEQRQRLRERQLGKKYGPETRAKLSAMRRGVPTKSPSEETRRKMSLSHLGKIPWNKRSSDEIAKAMGRK